jgi:DNA-binding PadR family transcriptional regulator
MSKSDAGNVDDGMKYYMTKDMYHLIMKLVILGKIKKGGSSIYAYELINHVAQHVPKYRKGKMAIKNDIYNTLSKFERLGYVNQQKKLSGGKIKNFYTLTKKGEKSLSESKKILKDAMKNVAKQLEG